MKILILTGIYPPDIGGPANYAKQLNIKLGKLGHDIDVVTYGIEKKLPTGIRHLYFLFKIIPAVLRTEFVILLDSFSVGLPGFIVAKLFRKKMIMRTGGDFVWEQYVERTGKKVLLSEFYEPLPDDLNIKEKFLLWWMRIFLHGLDAVIFSTIFQRDIFIKGYALPKSKTHIIENYYGKKFNKEKDKIRSCFGKKKLYLWAGRRIVLKNISSLKEAFRLAKEKDPSIELVLSECVTHKKLLEKMREVYVVIYPSLTEISPNFILEAIMLEKPFICTRDLGFYDRIKNIGIFVNPKSVEDISEKILYLADDNNYKKQLEKVKSFNYVHTYVDIAEEFEKIIKEVL